METITQEVDVRYFPICGEILIDTLGSMGNGDGFSSPLDNKNGRGHDCTGVGDSTGKSTQRGSTLGFMPPDEGPRPDIQ